MRDTFDKLRNLQEILSEKYEIERSLEEIPKRLLIKNEIVARLKRGKEEKESDIATLETEVTRGMHELEDKKLAREDLEKKMGLIKTQREFEALEREINETLLQEESLRKELYRKRKALEDIKAILSDDNALIEEQETELKEDRAKVERESLGDKKRLEELTEQEKSAAANMDSALVYKFESIIRNKAGLGIVAVKGGICLGCHMVLPYQFVNEVRAGEKVYFCPHCSRILFFEEGGEDYAAAFFDGDDMGGLADIADDEDEDEEEGAEEENADEYEER